MSGEQIIRCPQCNQRLRIPSDMGPLNVTCTACGAAFDWDRELGISGEKSNKPIEEHTHYDAADESSIFVREVAKYFMDFLETDFHRQRNPKRSIKLRNENNLLTGLELNKYPTFNSLMWRSIHNAFSTSPTIPKGRHKTSIPKNLLDLIRIQTEKLSSEQVTEISRIISEELENAVVLHVKDFERALTYALENAGKTIKKDLILPFVSNLESPLENLNLGDENTGYLMEEELTNVLVALLEDKASEVLKLLISKVNINVFEELDSVFDVDDIRNEIVVFFENFKVTDLFAEIYELDRNVNILDKQEFYFYFCDISYNRVRYPIFYIPFSLEKTDERL